LTDKKNPVTKAKKNKFLSLIPNVVRRGSGKSLVVLFGIVGSSPPLGDARSLSVRGTARRTVGDDHYGVVIES